MASDKLQQRTSGASGFRHYPAKPLGHDMNSMEKTEYLFSYGTLRDPAVQRAIFGKEVPMRAATLHGWSLRKADDGYLFIRPERGQSVSGMVLSVTQEHLHSADQWEEIPLYVREKVSASADGKREKVWAYTRRETEGEPFDQAALSALAPQDVLKAALALASHVAHVGVPRCDRYMVK